VPIPPMQRQANHILSRPSRSATTQCVHMYTTPGTKQRRFWNDISLFVNAIPWCARRRRRLKLSSQRPNGIFEVCRRTCHRRTTTALAWRWFHRRRVHITRITTLVDRSTAHHYRRILYMCRFTNVMQSDTMYVYPHPQDSQMSWNKYGGT
jgi:hypothetical protein